MDSQSSPLPGLVRDEAELINSAEHHLAHAAIALCEMMEQSADLEESAVDGRQLFHIRMGTLALLRAVRGWK